MDCWSSVIGPFAVDTRRTSDATGTRRVALPDTIRLGRGCGHRLTLHTAR